jgi:hypothetical protein
MVTRPTGGRRGRPRGPKMDDADRYALALFDCKISVAKQGGIKELTALKTMIGIAVGAVVPSPENFARMERGLAFQVSTPPLRLPKWRIDQMGRDPPAPVEDERFRNAFSPYVYRALHKLRRLRKIPDASGARHRVLVRLWSIFGEGDLSQIDLAHRLAA